MNNKLIKIILMIKPKPNIFQIKKYKPLVKRQRSSSK